MGWNFPHDLLEAAWGLIANAYGGKWDDADDKWRTAAEQWRDAYHATLPSGSAEQVADLVAKATANPGKTFTAESE